MQGTVFGQGSRFRYVHGAERLVVPFVDGEVQGVSAIDLIVDEARTGYDIPRRSPNL